jgi:hypothetical protein
VEFRSFQSARHAYQQGYYDPLDTMPYDELEEACGGENAVQRRIAVEPLDVIAAPTGLLVRLGTAMPWYDRTQGY